MGRPGGRAREVQVRMVHVLHNSYLGESVGRTGGRAREVQVRMFHVLQHSLI